MNLFPLLDGRANHAQRRAIASRRQRAGVAVGQHSAFARHQRRAVASHGLVRGNIFRVHALGLFHELSLDLCDGTNPYAFEFLLHPPDGPEKIHRRRPRLADYIADLIEIALEIADRLRLRVLHAQRNPHGCRHADSGRSPHHHRSDGVGNLLVLLQVT